MAYASGNPKTKKQLKEWVATGRPNGDKPRVQSAGPFPATENGREFIEGPHHPAPHTWYAQVEVRDGVIVKVVK